MVAWVTRGAPPATVILRRRRSPSLAGRPAIVTPALLTSGGPLNNDFPRRRSHTQANPAKQGLYIFGQSNIPLVDWIGLLASGPRVAARRAASIAARLSSSIQQTGVHLQRTSGSLANLHPGLLCTGLIIHKPDIFGILPSVGGVRS